VCDSEMVAHGVTRKRLPADNDVICLLRDERVPDHAAAIGNTRSAAAVDFWEEHLEGSVVAIGNAPTTLFHLLNRLAGGAETGCRARIPRRVHRSGREQAGARRDRQQPSLYDGPWPAWRQCHGRGRRQCACQ